MMTILTAMSSVAWFVVVVFDVLPNSDEVVTQAEDLNGTFRRKPLIESKVRQQINETVNITRL
uniref:Col_cuticle_N domain-containing protein n=1 Tax=Heterorhabditis bacteriophora TaxID=37862 RepID=A0A1I7X403_HETBA